MNEKYSDITFVNFGCKHSLFSSYNEVNVRLTYIRQNNVRLLYMRYQNK